MIFEFTKGKHFSKPRIWQITPFTKRIKGYVQFTKDSKYTCDDQDDWNKLCGISFGLKPNKNAVMFAYKYNPQEDYWQIIPYINRNFNKEFNFHSLILREGEIALLNIVVNKHNVLFKANRKSWILKAPDTSWFSTIRQPYHGGNTTPNNDYSLFFKYL
jgi:hypothetical protein